MNENPNYKICTGPVAAVSMSVRTWGLGIDRAITVYRTIGSNLVNQESYMYWNPTKASWARMRRVQDLLYERDT